MSFGAAQGVVNRAEKRSGLLLLVLLLSKLHPEERPATPAGRLVLALLTIEALAAANHGQTGEREARSESVVGSGTRRIVRENRPGVP